jgi:D-alanyl-D-alanine carboxypeptidase
MRLTRLLHHRLGILASVCLFLVNPVVAAESYIIVDNQTGYVLASKESNQKRQVASLTKVATALVVLDWARATNADLGEFVSVPESAVRVGGVNPAGLQTGDMVTLRDLLYSALMASDNIAAHTLAYHIGRRLPNPEALDPVGNFVAHMNALARNLGMKRTRFLNPSGLDSGSGAVPFSTAADMARLTRYAYSKSGFPFYVAQKTREIHIMRAGQPVDVWLRNTNPLLDVDGVDGVKTGRTAKAGDCIILSADRAPESRREGETVFVTPRRIIVVLLGSSDRSGEGISFIRRGWQLYDEWAAKGRPIKKGESLQ